MKQRDLLVRRVYTHKTGVEVIVEIDFARETVSLVEADGKRKQWLFAQRQINYMQGWQNILDAMKHAVTEAAAELDADQRRRAMELAQQMAALNKSEKAR